MKQIADITLAAKNKSPQKWRWSNINAHGASFTKRLREEQTRAQNGKKYIIRMVECRENNVDLLKTV